MPSDLIAPHVHAFFAEYLCQQRQLSPQTILSCRDTFRVWRTLLRDHTDAAPAALRMAAGDAPGVRRFLHAREQERRHSVRSRQIRVAAIRSFVRFVALRDPESLGMVTRVLAMPVQRTDPKLIGYLTRPAIQALLAAPDRSKWVGRRDHALRVTRYKSGARVSEVTTLKRGQLCGAERPCVHRLGNGRKERTVPLWADTARVLRGWFQELGEGASPVAFPRARGTALARDGVDDLVKQAIQRAVASCPSLATKPISPHVIRHTTAMPLLQAGVDIATMALGLGHESIDTTHMSLQADLAMTEKALEKLAPPEGAWKRFQADDPLLAFLASL